MATPAAAAAALKSHPRLPNGRRDLQQPQRRRPPHAVQRCSPPTPPPISIDTMSCSVHARLQTLLCSPSPLPPSPPPPLPQLQAPRHETAWHTIPVASHPSHVSTPSVAATLHTVLGGGIVRADDASACARDVAEATVIVEPIKARLLTPPPPLPRQPHPPSASVLRLDGPLATYKCR
jgi:hypothetical protein